jgi:hypothetical protein
MTATDYSQRIAFQAYALSKRFSKATLMGQNQQPNEEYERGGRNTSDDFHGGKIVRLPT